MCVCVYVLQVANHQQVIPEVVNITIYLLDNFSSTEAKSVIRFLFLIRDLWFGSAGSFRSELIVTRPETQQSGWVGVNEYLFLDYSVCVGGGRYYCCSYVGCETLGKSEERWWVWSMSGCKGIDTSRTKAGGTSRVGLLH